MLSIKPNATYVPEEIKNKVLLPKTKLRSDTKTLMVINQYVAVLANIYVIYNNHSHNFVNMHYMLLWCARQL